MHINKDCVDMMMTDKEEPFLSENVESPTLFYGVWYSPTIS